MKKITEKQRKNITKAASIGLGVLMICASLAAVPKAVSMIPDISGGFGFSPVFERDEPSFAPVIESEETSFEESTDEPPKEPSEGDLFVTAGNLCWYGIDEEADIFIINRTDYDVDPKEFLKKDYPIKTSSRGSEPTVLIIHTHGSESYLENGVDFYSADETFRSDDEAKTVVHIGDVLCKRLNESGVFAIHDRTMYDTIDFNKSYSFSKAGAEEYLEKYPTIQYIIDLHRDSVFDSKGRNVKPITSFFGEECAQIMLVVGTDGGGNGHANWRDNFTFAVYLEEKLNERFPTLARPINLRTAAFNQMLTKGSVILECGSCGNTVEEAERAVLHFADAFAELVKSH